LDKSIFHNDFKAKPFWWEAYQPVPLPEIALPKEVEVIVVGAGYAGLNAALELNKNGISCLLLDAAEPGFGGSSRNGGQVSGGVNVGKRIINRALTGAEATPFLNDAADAFSTIEQIISSNNIDCGWHKKGYFLGAWCKSHYDSLAKKASLLNHEANAEAFIVPPERQREELGSDYYHGGMVIQRAAHLHPALYFKGLLDLACKAGIAIASKTPATEFNEIGNSWLVKTPRGSIKCRDVIIATNGYTGGATPELQRRVVPVGSYIIATEELPSGLADELIPRHRSVADTRRVLTYYRLSPDRKRLIFGGRAKFGFSDPVETAPMLYRFMTDRFPQLKGTKVTHAWTGNVAFTLDELPHMGKHKNMHYALGCNGSGIAMMTYLGRQTALKVLRTTNRSNAFDLPEFPIHPLYQGNPWFLPLIGSWFRFRDWTDRTFN
jgi:glycine/D-amino acid oxidase-like deaminating enzyme